MFLLSQTALKRVDGWHTVSAALLLLALMPARADQNLAPPAWNLVVAAWNIEHLAADDGAGCRPRDAAEYTAIRDYLNRVGADVIAFQEVEDRVAAERVFPAADYDIHISERPTRELPACRGSGNKRLMQRTGFAVRRDMESRLGLRVVRQTDLEALGGAEDAGRRGVHILLQRINAPDRRPLRLLSIHLKSRCVYQAIRGGKRHCAILGEQVETLSDWIAARSGAKQNFIIAGDFNRQLDQPDDEMWRLLKAGVNVDLEKALHGIDHPRPWYKKYPYAIDHIIYNRAVKAMARADGERFDLESGEYSDHLLLLATFDLTR